MHAINKDLVSRFICKEGINLKVSFREQTIWLKGKFCNVLNSETGMFRI